MATDYTQPSGTSGFASKYLQNVKGTGTAAGTSTTKIIDGKAMTLTQAINYFNQARINDYNGKYQVLKQMTGYTGKNDNSALSSWSNFVRDLFASTAGDLNTYASQRATTGGGTTTASYPSLTSKETADFNLEKLYRDYLGSTVKPTAAEKAAYYNKLNALEKSRPTKQVTSSNGVATTQTTISGVSDVEKEQVGLEFVSKYIKTGDIKTIGGTIASNIAAIGKFAADNFISLNDSEVRQNALMVATGGQTALDTIQSRIKLMAKAAFPSIGQWIDAGLSVRDVAGQYIAEKANILELNPATIDVKDNDVMQAISGPNTESLFDFRKRMRSNPLFQYTNSARSEAATIISKVKQDFRMA